MKAKRLLVGLVLLNLGVFFVTAAFLPRDVLHTYKDFMDEFVNGRVHWDIAWSVTLGSSLLSTGLAKLLTLSKSNADEK